MNVFIGLLIFAAFLQTSFVGINLVLLLIASRSFVIETRSNYFLAFGAGILVGILSAQNIGYWPLILLITVKIAHLIRKLPFSISILTFIPVLILSLSVATGVEYLFLKQTINWVKVAVEFIVGIPIFLFIRFWEDRFMIHSQSVKLRMRK
jgi:hypothetical protein